MKEVDWSDCFDGGNVFTYGSANKLLLPLENQSIAACTTKNYRSRISSCDCSDGYEAPNIRETLRHLDVVLFIMNILQKGWEHRFEQHKKAVQEVDGVLIAMGDMPFVSVDILKEFKTL